MFAGQSPTNIGINNGKLTACPNTPNCVNSQAPVTDKEHAIASLPLSGDLSSAMANLKQVVQAMPRTKIVKETNNYLYVEFASKLMGFVDDVEFYLDNDAQTIQVRSASRLGESDLGVNRLPHCQARVVIRRRFQHAQLQLIARRVGLNPQKIGRARLQ